MDGQSIDGNRSLFLGGVISHAAGYAGGESYWQSTATSALVGGATSWATGGDVYWGAMNGAYVNTFNSFGYVMKGYVKDALKNVLYNKQSIQYRNALNQNTPKTKKEALSSGYKKQTFSQSLLHKLGGPSSWLNEKYVDPTGFKEVVYNSRGEVVGGINAGTYNVVPNSIDPLGHFIWDMAPFFLGI